MFGGDEIAFSNVRDDGKAIFGVRCFGMIIHKLYNSFVYIAFSLFWGTARGAFVGEAKSALFIVWAVGKCIGSGMRFRSLAVLGDRFAMLIR